MKKRWYVFLFCFIVLAFILVPWLLIRHAKSLLDEGEKDRLHCTPPTDAFYDGMSILNGMTWLPYFGSWAQEIIDVHAGPYIACYLLDKNRFQSKNSLELYFRLLNERDSIIEATGDSDRSTPYPEYPAYDFSDPLPPAEHDAFCEEWGRFQQFLNEVNHEGQNLIGFEECK